ncbi:hypothetical protein KFE25_014064 [Diacronema lutheri]|uniref:Exostosin GT47 domain-containing protein n=1 Tax=Diacronema lutheri TaxID=2081491 RepID=A0A8J5X6S7_DIALT|nr:hypothetical protein KFE25_014064 [Diacronema lutheri]
MPACEASDGETINLSILSTQPFWHQLPNLASGKEPPIRWLGPLPCACVLQAVTALAGAHTGAFAPWWGASADMLYAARVPCVRAPADATVADLARGGGAADGQLHWAAVAVFAWDFKLANNPYLLLPPLREHARWAPARWSGVELADGARSPQQPHLLDEAAVGDTWVAALQRDVAADDAALASRTRAAASPPRREGVSAAVENLALPSAGWEPPTSLLAASECERGCSGAGWCVAPAAGATRADASPICECFSQIGAALDRALPGGERARMPHAPPADCAAGAAFAADGSEWAGAGAGAGAGRFGPDRWRRWHWSVHYDHLRTELPTCPNGCSAVGRCEYGFCACPLGRWGVDCGHSRERARAELAAVERGDAGGARPRIFVHNVPPAARRACSPWVLPEQLGDLLLRSAHSTALPETADFFWLYGCSLAGSLVVHALDWVRTRTPHWNRTAAVAAAAAATAARAPALRAEGAKRRHAPTPTHLIVAPSEHGWAEAWQAVWFGRGAHSALSPAHLRPGSAWWRQLAPDSAERLLGALQLEGAADTRFKREFPPCHICFQRGKDVMLPTFRRTNDYPTDGDCARLRTGLSPWSAAASAAAPDEAAAAAAVDAGRPVALFFAGAIQTKKDVQPSRYEPWRLWRNASGFRILQTERHPFVVDPSDGWSEHVDLYSELRGAQTCMVPMGKTGNYGQRMIPAALAGCIPVITKAAGSAHPLDESLPWPLFSLHVPHERAATLGPAIRALGPERRRAMQRELGCAWRRLLWTRLYGTCVGTERAHLGEADAFDTLMDALRRRAEGLPPAPSACDIRAPAAVADSPPS